MEASVLKFTCSSICVRTVWRMIKRIAPVKAQMISRVESRSCDCNLKRAMDFSAKRANLSYSRHHRQGRICSLRCERSQKNEGAQDRVRVSDEAAGHDYPPYGSMDSSDIPRLR